MGELGKAERATQDRVIALFTEQLGYRWLGNWSKFHNQAINEETLTDWLETRGHSSDQIDRAIYLLQEEVKRPGRSLYDRNEAVYSLLRYGAQTRTSVAEKTGTVQFIDWENPEANHFALAEEVTLRPNDPVAFERRPDLVLFINGIAIGVIELKRSAVSIGDGIRQLLSNQQPQFNEWFFSTVQLLIAGNDTEGLRYGTIGTPEKMFLSWKEDETDNAGYKLDKYLLKLGEKHRLIELLHDFVLFDGGVKKLPRPHQYFGIKAAQGRLQKYEGGIIWHTQGSGKSIVMVLLAKWILENLPNARVLIITDRDELDDQIHGVFTGIGEEIYRTKSGADLMVHLGQARPRLLCSLVHKFGLDARGKKKGEFEDFIAELKARPSPAVGELFIFVDECHRTQTGRLHQVMKALLPGAVFVGFTGTPLLKADSKTSMEVFGSYIHTYKFGEAVEDGVVLDLVYEARDIPQELSSETKIDQWFDAKTKGLNDWQKATLREQWGTMQRVLSSRSRMDRVVADIVFDFGVQPRLVSQRGNAILVTSSIYEASRYYELFEKTLFKGHCAVITSYNPSAQDVTTEETGANTETEKQFLFNTYNDLLKNVSPKPGKNKTETYEDESKDKFIKQPANMKLLIVVDKLLTGFDAPSCTYLYLDKKMQDHGLFQAVCRTNRLDGEDKPFGYIVDYKDLFNRVQGAISLYTSELDAGDGNSTPEVLMLQRLEAGRERLEEAREQLALLCEQVPSPGDELAHIHYFCGNTEIETDLTEREPQRATLYKRVAALVRAYASLADELPEAGYSAGEVANVESELKRAVELRAIVRQASGEQLDVKVYEADMRHLIDTYIKADEARTISDFGEIGLLDLLVNSGIAAALAKLPPTVAQNPNAVAETIANNVRSKIIKDHLNDPAFYDKMSKLLAEILEDLKARRIDYQQFLDRIRTLAEQVQAGMAESTPEPLRKSAGLRALYNHFAEYPAGGDPETLLKRAQALHDRLKQRTPDGWRGVPSKEQAVKRLLYEATNDPDLVEQLFLIVQAQRDEY